MIYFVSDAHLGSRVMENPHEHQQRLVDLLMHMSHDATEIYLLGDIFDFWFETFYPAGQRAKREQYDPVLSALKSLTDNGIQVHFYIGNHDIWTFGWLARETGVIVHRKPELCTLAGRRVYLSHGDGIVPSDFMNRIPKPFRRKIRHFMLLRALFHNPVAQILGRLLPWRWFDNMGYRWAESSRRKELANPCAYKGENQEELILFAKEQEQKEHIDYYIFGHRHIELDLELASTARVIILGEFFSLYTYGAMNEEGEFELRNWEE